MKTEKESKAIESICERLTVAMSDIGMTISYDNSIEDVCYKVRSTVKHQSVAFDSVDAARRDIISGLYSYLKGTEDY